MTGLIVRFRTQFVKRIHPGDHRARIGLFKISSLSHVCEEHTYVSEQYIFKIQTFNKMWLGGRLRGVYAKTSASPASAEGISLPKVVVSRPRERTFGKWDSLGPTPGKILSEQVGVSSTREATF